MRFSFPHPLVLLVAGVLLAAGLTYVVPAGRYERRDDPATGQRIVVAGTYRPTESRPVNPFRALVDVPRGLINAADIVFFVFLVGGGFAVVERTGALRTATDALARRAGRGAARAWVVPLVGAAFALGGALENLQEEIIPLVPVLLLLCRRLRFDGLTAVSMSIGAAHVGAAFSPVNPFQVLVAQRLAELPPFSGALWRTVFLVPAVAAWLWGTNRHALRVAAKEQAEAAATAGAATAPSGGNPAGDGPAPAGAAAEGGAADAGPPSPSPRQAPGATPAAGPRPDGGSPSAPAAVSGTRTAVVLGLTAAAFALFVYGVVRLHWGFEETATVFLVLGVVAGLTAGLGLTGTAEAFVAGFRDMAFAALLIGFARAIYVVLDEGAVVDTLVSALFQPLAGLPPGVAAAGMIAAQAVVHLPVPSVSGQAVLTLPILVPLSDLLGLSREVTVLAYGYGAGLGELLIPTNGALMAILAATGVRFGTWLRFAVPLVGLLWLVGLASTELAILAGLR